jgi:hypothetical protein
MFHNFLILQITAGAKKAVRAFLSLALAERAIFRLLNIVKIVYIQYRSIKMSTVKAYYDGITFFPIQAPNLPTGRVVNLTIEEEDTPSPEIAKKLAQLAVINNNLEKLNETEPLPPEFDEILSQRVNFARVLNL